MGHGTLCLLFLGKLCFIGQCVSPSCQSEEVAALPMVSRWCGLCAGCPCGCFIRTAANANSSDVCEAPTSVRNCMMGALHWYVDGHDCIDGAEVDSMLDCKWALNNLQISVSSEETGEWDDRPKGCFVPKGCTSGCVAQFGTGSGRNNGEHRAVCKRHCDWSCCDCSKIIYPVIEAIKQDDDSGRDKIIVIIVSVVICSIGFIGCFCYAIMRVGKDSTVKGGEGPGTVPTPNILGRGDLVSSWGYLKKNQYKYSMEREAVLLQYLSDPSNWGISWDALERVHQKAHSTFGESYSRKSTFDVVQFVVKPACMEHGAPMALVENGWEIQKVEGFVTHAWHQPFSEFVESLRKLYTHWLVMPSLFICALAIYQGEVEDMQGALGNEIESAPFLQSMYSAEHFTIVRSSAVDVYARAWCFMEMIIAKKCGLYPDNLHLAGEDVPMHPTAVEDMQATVKEDHTKLMRAVLRQGDPATLESQLKEFRNFKPSAATIDEDGLEIDDPVNAMIEEALNQSSIVDTNKLLTMSHRPAPP